MGSGGFELGGLWGGCEKGEVEFLASANCEWEEICESGRWHEL